MTHAFSATELATLREHRIELFADRVIFDAQPPMDEDAIAAVQALCAGPLPPALRALWRQTAGGRLDYALSVPMPTRAGSRVEAVSWCELFYHGSRFYNDLQGWIEHEQEQAREIAEDDGREWDGKLFYLPIGGFEYRDRIYVVTAPGAPDDGGVLAWKMGLPPAWSPALTEDAVATFAPDLHTAFGCLALHDDPLAPGRGYGSGSELLEYLEQCRKDGLPAALADALLAFYLRARIDWRGLLDSGTLAAHPRALQLALAHAVEQDDAALLQRIAAAGCALDGIIIGAADALAYARKNKKDSAVAVLVGLGMR
ncbi:hypothetical protein [Tahibacter harae]|uniref:SMI1/KNR4 family protein SUKH-1 n=1 Tax=Tahibacter harae TaxID=2963937 RepID=A0ABT1QUY4_9GAMM|nr:hypothetical protein [Tahibacter harae]MCQ4166093.1 hypothetical protein [Tahibacter harae]